MTIGMGITQMQKVFFMDILNFTGVESVKNGGGDINLTISKNDLLAGLLRQ
jgi:hypothetical protein